MANIADFIEQSGGGSGFVYKTVNNLYYYDGTDFLETGVDATFIATTGSGTNMMNISSVTSGVVNLGMTVTGGTLTGAQIVGFDTFDGTSGIVILSIAQTWVNPTNITATTAYPDQTVRGIVYLDGTYYVMTPDALIYGSAINDPTNWSSLNVISAQSEPDPGVCLARQLNLIVAFGTYSTEFFYNAANPTGSPLLPYTSAFLEIGCATAGSVINAENSLIFMSVGRQKGRSISLLEGTTPKVLSTPYIDRLLNADSLANVTSYYIKVKGHGFYILTLPASDLTLVYDFTSAKWSKWTQLLLYPFVDKVATGMTWQDGLVTASYPNHEASDGDVVEITTALPAGYNGQYVVNVLDDDTLTYAVATNPGTYISGGVVQPYEESLFNMASYTNTPSFDLVQDSTTGIIYSVSTETYQDNECPIRYSIRTENLDGGTNFTKFYSRLEVIGDKVEGTLYSRHTDDDYRTYSKYRPMNLSNKRSQIYRLGSARRRAFEFINYDNVPIRLNNMEFSVEKGYT